VRLSVLLAAAPEVILFEARPFSDMENFSLEAAIRLIRTQLPNARMYFVTTTEVDRFDDATIFLADARQYVIDGRAIAAYYGIPSVDYIEELEALITGGGHLATYYADSIHPTAAGQAVIRGLFAPSKVLESLTLTTPLPARLYADSADFEIAPTVQHGIDYDSRTGTWTDTGNSTASSEVDATITFKGTFRSFGCYRATGAYPAVYFSVNGDAYSALFASFDCNGWDLGTRDVYTITIKVATAVQIDEFWTI
jgi:hypothetical protein